MAEGTWGATPALGPAGGGAPLPAVSAERQAASAEALAEVREAKRRHEEREKRQRLAELESADL